MDKAGIKHDPRNARKHNPRNLAQIESSIQRDGFGRSILLAADGTVIAGNATIDSAASAGLDDVIVVETDGTKVVAVKRTDVAPGSEQFHRLALADNRAAELASWDAEVLAGLNEEMDLSAFFAEDELGALLARVADEPAAAESRSLADRFGVPPFSVLDARQGYWQERKRAWLALGIRSELGRGENALGFSEGVNDRHGRGEGPYAKAKASPGGSPDAATRLENGKTVRGDGHGRGLARVYGQDLMKGEHTLGAIPPNERAILARSGKYATGNGARLTWVAGNRDNDELDDTSRKNLAGGRKMGGRPPHGATVTQNPDGTLAYRPTNAADGEGSGISVFDPVLCELVYRWFCPPEGVILDPFAGGSVRGIVAARLGRSYVGIDLSGPQLDANRIQADRIVPEAQPVWIEGDSTQAATLAPGAYDFIFSCPPYADLEVYSDDPRDLSTMDYAAFVQAYRAIIAASVAMLKDDRFACFVVGDVRDSKGFYRNFVSDTIAAFQDSGATLYNEAILVTAVGSLPIRVGRQFEAGRKLGKTHQNVLVFLKGEPRRAVEAIGAVEFGEVLAEGEA